MDNDIRAMQVFVDTMVGIPRFSYPAKKNAPRPPGEFAHIQLLEEYQKGIPANYTYAQDDLTTTTRTHSLALLRYRIGIVDTDGIASIKIMHKWTTQAIKSLMITSGYGFVRIEPISLEDAKLESVEWEPRQGFSVELYVDRIFQEVVNNITSASISGEFITIGLDSILLNIDINEA